MFNFKKVSEVIKKVTSTVLTATLSLSMFSKAPIKAMYDKKIDYTLSCAFVGEENSGKTDLFDELLPNESKISKCDDGAWRKFVGSYAEKGKNYEIGWFDISSSLDKNKDMYAGVVFVCIDFNDENWKEHINKWLKKVSGATMHEKTFVRIVITNYEFDFEKKTSPRNCNKEIEIYLKNEINKQDYENLDISEKPILSANRNEEHLCFIDSVNSAYKDRKSSFEKYSMLLAKKFVIQHAKKFMNQRADKCHLKMKNLLFSKKRPVLLKNIQQLVLAPQ